jgi:hypothetical protein
MRNKPAKPQTPILDHVDTLREWVEQYVESNESLQHKLEAAKQPASKDEVATVLRSALDNKTGWRIEARRVLGLVNFLKCNDCDAMFEGGGKLKKRCASCAEARK